MIANTSDREIVQTRLIKAPRKLVFQAWTDAKHLGHWFGPKGFTTTTHKFEFQVGGVWDFIMHAPDGTDFPNAMVFREIVEPERLVYEHGAFLNDPHAFHVTVTFTEEAGGTRYMMKSIFKTREECEAVKGFGAVELGQQTIDKLEAYAATLG